MNSSIISITLWFFIVVPTFFLLNKYGVGLDILVFANRIILAGFVGYCLYRIRDIRRSVSRYRTLLICVAVFIFFQYLYQYIYFTLPEWDTYGDLKTIKRLVSLNTLVSTYRPLYYAAVVMLSKTLSVSAYNILLYFILPIQAMVIIVGFYFLKKSSTPILALVPLAVPVIALEMGTLRAQTMLIAFLPVFFYFIGRHYETRKSAPLYLAGIISLVGMYYHELFAFLFLSLVTYFISFQLRIYKRSQKKILLMSFLLCVSTFMWLSEIVPSLGFVKLFVSTLLSRISNTENWKLWFLGSYGTDGLDIGWSGLSGIIQYYGYYVSPILLLVGFMASRKLRDIFRKDSVSSSLMVLFVVCLSLSELFPRFGFTYLPERMWLVGDLSLVLLFSRLAGGDIQTRSLIKRPIVYALLLILMLVGISGATYVAYQKKSLTTEQEMDAAYWLKQNTPNDSLVYSQPANVSLVEYFGEREIITNLDILLDTKGLKPQTPILYADENELSDQLLTKIKNFDIANGNIGVLVSEIQRYRELTSAPENSVANPMTRSGSVYLLYSKQKFQNMYATRNWWLKTNYYGADISNLNNRYKLMYQNNGIFIWQIK